jgi:prepilin-type N-terminal cleavage/methylation domain-containing protein
MTILDNKMNVTIDSRRDRAFSLVEVMVAIFLFAIVSLGLIKLVLLTRIQSEVLIYDNIALSLAQGYLEQMRSLGYSELLQASEDSTYELDTVSVSLASGSVLAATKPLYAGIGNTVSVTVDVSDVDSLDAGKEMSVELTPTIESISSVSGISAVHITLSYSYNVSVSGGGERTKTHELRTVVASLN